MGFKIADLFAEVSVKDAKYNKAMKGVKDKAKKGESAMGSFAKKARNLFAGLAAIGFAKSFLSSSIRALKVQEKAVSNLNAVVKATGGAAGFSSKELQKYAAGLQKVTTYGDEVIIQGQAILATFKNIKGDVFKRSTDAILDMATVLGTDLNSAAILVGKALNDPIKGLTALSRSGVTFTEQQKDMVKQLVESNRTIDAQTLILRELESQFKGAAQAAAGTLTGQMDQVAAQFGDMKEKLGENIMISIVGVGQALGILDTPIEKMEKSFERMKNELRNLDTTGSAYFDNARNANERIVENLSKQITSQKRGVQAAEKLFGKDSPQAKAERKHLEDLKQQRIKAGDAAQRATIAGARDSALSPEAKAKASLARGSSFFGSNIAIAKAAAEAAIAKAETAASRKALGLDRQDSITVGVGGRGIGEDLAGESALAQESANFLSTVKESGMTLATVFGNIGKKIGVDVGFRAGSVRKFLSDGLKKTPKSAPMKVTSLDSFINKLLTVGDKFDPKKAAGDQLAETKKQTTKLGEVVNAVKGAVPRFG